MLILNSSNKAEKNENERSLHSSEALLEKSQAMSKKGSKEEYSTNDEKKFQAFFKTNFPWHAIFVAENVDKALEEVRKRKIISTV